MSGVEVRNCDVSIFSLSARRPIVKFVRGFIREDVMLRGPDRKPSFRIQIDVPIYDQPAIGDIVTLTDVNPGTFLVGDWEIWKIDPVTSNTITMHLIKAKAS